MRPIIFYISGHGYGHAVRTGEVIRALQRLRPSRRIIVRTRASQRMLPERVEYSRSDFEPGVVEREAGLVIDEEATLTEVKNFVSQWSDALERESAYVREVVPQLIIADIPAIAGDVARASGIPCIGISNFTWDWIFEPYASDWLEPFERGTPECVHCCDCRFISPRGSTHCEHSGCAFDCAVYKGIVGPAQVGEDTSSARLTRANLEEALAEASRNASDFEFVRLTESMSYVDALASCDLVIAKLGFSMLAECIAAGKRLLYPPRENFREEVLLQEHAGRHVPALPIPLHHFREGKWESYLRALVAMPEVTSDIRTDGARVCAEFIASV